MVKPQTTANPIGANNPPDLICAVPDYLQKVAKESNMPPGHRFNLYAPMWSNESFEKENAIKVGKSGLLKKLSGNYSDDTIKLSDSLFNRQKLNAQKMNAAVFPLTLNAPLAVGMGNEHPVENGFSFLSPYGLPYIAGSGIKGMLRSSALENPDVSDEELIELFGSEDEAKPRKGALVFWDCFPQCNKMAVEVMTPHNSAYYEGKESPHDQGQPMPITFLAVPVNTIMNLIVQCDERLIKGNYNWKDKIEEILRFAEKWRGFGAKTAVGYGSFKLDEVRLKQMKDDAETKAKEEAEKQKLANMTPEEREKAEFSKELECFKVKFDDIKTKEKSYNPSSSKINQVLPQIYAISEKLRTNECKLLLEEILKFVKDNKNKKNEVKSKIAEFFS